MDIRSKGIIQTIIANGALNIVLSRKSILAIGGKTIANNKAIAVNSSSPYGLSLILSTVFITFGFCIYNLIIF